MIQNLGNGKVQLILLQELTYSDAKDISSSKKIVFLCFSQNFANMWLSRLGVKDYLNLIATLLLIAGGVCTILLGFTLPGQSPFPVLGHVKTFELIIAGTILIILSLGPFTTFFNKGNLSWNAIELWRNQALRELNLALGSTATVPRKDESSTSKDMFIEHGVVQEDPTTPRLKLNTLDPEMSFIETACCTQSETVIDVFELPDRTLSATSIINAMHLEERGSMTFPLP